MREIKFRCWDKKEKKMFDVAQMTANSKGNMNNIPDRIPMQYTNIKDIYEYEIYEGDILKRVQKKVKSRNTGKLIKNGSSVSKFIVQFKDGHFNIRTNKRFEIIGNICEDPELIGKV